MKYFLCNGYQPNPLPPIVHGSGYTETNLSGPDDGETVAQRAKFFEKVRHKPPAFGENTLLRNREFGRISIFVYDVYRTFLLIASKSQRKAYFLGNSLKAILSTIFGDAPVERRYRFLLEFFDKPVSTMDVSKIANLIQS